MAFQAPPPRVDTISPEQAQRAAAVLQDDRQRAEALRTLKAIADSAPAASSSVAASPPPTAPAQADTGAAAPTADAKAVPLEANGLIARMLRHIGRWVDGLGQQLGQLKVAALALPNLFVHAVNSVATGAHHGVVLKLLAILAGVFALGLVLEWGLYRLLRRPRAALIAHADAADAEHRRADEQEAARVAAASPEAANANADTAAKAADVAGTAPPSAPANGDVALVMTHRDGVDQVEAVPVAAGDGGAGAAPAEPVPDKAPPPPPKADSSHVHLRTLRHLPYAIATLVLDLLPIALFFVSAGLLLRWLAADEPAIYDVTGGFINAYVTTRVGMAILRLLVSPVGHGLRLLKMGPRTAHSVMAWGRGILVVGAFGIALADATEILGGGGAERRALIKLVSLVVHVCVVILIFRVRRHASARIAAPAGMTGPLATARNWLAEVWAYAAAILVMGLWVVWALGVEDGFPKLLHFVGVTAAVIIAARVLSVVILGAVSRAFQPPPAPQEAGVDTQAARQARIDVHRYYPFARAVVTAVMTVCCVVALLQVWGVDALGWFAAGTIGRSMASAALTILVAAVVAIVVWEVVNAGVNRRLDRWNQQGDLMRAARLRTLLPMLRTCLLVVMVLIVGLTALSQIGVNTTPLLAGASIIGVALGFGSQKLVQDFITGIFLLMENAMQVGDWVTVGDVSGSVEYLSIRTVRLRGGDGSLYTVPFSSVTTVNNTNRGIGNAAMKVSLAYDSDVQRAIDELKNLGAALRTDPAFKDLILADIEVWGVDAVDGHMFTLAGQIRCTDKGRWGVQRELNRRILERFRKIGIEVANPHETVLLTPSTHGEDAAGEPEKDGPTTA